jgi:hypothetical protein
VIETREEVTRALLVWWWLRSAIEAEQGAIRIAPLARELGLSQDALEKRLRRAVGASPKQFASSCRPSAATTRTSWRGASTAAAGPPAMPSFGARWACSQSRGRDGHLHVSGRAALE